MKLFLKHVLVTILLNCLVLGQIPSSPTLTAVADHSYVTGSTANIYCTPSGNWIGPTMDGPANMPVRCMNTALSNTPAPGATRGPDSTTATVQADINAAACGDKVLVAAGSTIGPINLPIKSCDNFHWIWILTTGYTNSNFPTEGTMVTPCASGLLTFPNRPSYPCTGPAQVSTFKIVAPPSGNAITSTNGGDHYRMIGAEITRPLTGGIAIYNLVDLTASLNQVNNLIFDRDWFHGVNQDGHFPFTVQTSDTSTTRAIWLGQSNHVAIIDSYFSDFYDTSAMSANGNTDAQCVGGGSGGIQNSGWGAYKFVNNHCEASGEGILLGGAGGPKLSPAGCTIRVNCNIDVPSDIEIRSSYFFKPATWNGNTTVPSGTGWPVIKNGFEMKTGLRVFAEGNVIENTWYQAQVGWCFTIAPKNQPNGAGTLPTDPTALTDDFVYRYNYCYHVAYGFGFYGSPAPTCSTCQSQGGDRISIHDILIDGLKLGNLSGQSAGDGMSFTSAGDPTGQGLEQLNNVKLDHITVTKAVRYSIGLGANQLNQMHNWQVTNIIFYKGNFGAGANPSSGGCVGTADSSDSLNILVTGCITTATVTNNAQFAMTSATIPNWPAGNIFLQGTSTIQFLNYNGGDSGYNPGNYQLLSTSSLHNKATDGTDIGVDIPTLLKMIAGVRK